MVVMAIEINSESAANLIKSRLIISSGQAQGHGLHRPKITPQLRRGSRPVSPGKERRRPLRNTRRSCSAASAPRWQVVAPKPFCSREYKQSFPESNPVPRLAETSRPASEPDDDARQGKPKREVTCVPSRFLRLSPPCPHQTAHIFCETIRISRLVSTPPQSLLWL
jgi:hypothetical protein